MKKEQDEQKEKKSVKTYEGIANKDFTIYNERGEFGKVFKTTSKSTYDLLIKTKRIR